MADEPNNNPNPQPSPAPEGTSGGDGKNTQGDGAGAGTPTAQTPEKVDVTQTKEFKDAVTAAVANKIPQLKKQIGKELAGEKDGQPSVEDLQRGVEEAQRNLRFYQARDQVEDYIADKRNNANIKNVKAFCRYFKDDFTFDDEGKVSNLKDLYTRAKVETPELLGMVTGSADGAAGNGQVAVGADMNQIIRGAAGF